MMSWRASALYLVMVVILATLAGVMRWPMAATIPGYVAIGIAVVLIEQRLGRRRP